MLRLTVEAPSLLLLTPIVTAWRGGLEGGKARAAKMTPEERSESARKAAKARWAKRKQQEDPS